MDDIFLALLVAGLALAPAAAVLVHWIRHVRRRRAELRRAQGLRLIHALSAYSAWIASASATCPSVPAASTS
jgi:beta-lactamase regulating signal transducer with metallopeptidase domain